MVTCSAAGEGRWVSTKWLERCLTELPETVGEIDNGPLLCKHGKADPAKAAMSRP